MHKNKFRSMSTKTLTYCALLAALSVVLARLIGLMPSESARFSIEAVPIILAGLLFGPLPGALVGFAADFVGCLFSAFGYNPIFCLPPILYGLFAGMFRYRVAGKNQLFWLIAAVFCPVLLGSILYQSAALAYVYDGVFLQGFLLRLGTRSIQFSITFVLDVAAVWFLLRSGLFHRIGIWPPVARKEYEP